MAVYPPLSYQLSYKEVVYYFISYFFHWSKLLGAQELLNRVDVVSFFYNLPYLEHVPLDIISILSFCTRRIQYWESFVNRNLTTKTQMWNILKTSKVK